MKPKSKKVIGYKLIKQEYIKACNIIVGINDESDFYVKNLAGPQSTAKEDLSKSGVLDIWFEPVYESSTEQNLIEYFYLKGRIVSNEEIKDIVKLVNEK